jgi:short-subunit dehydrogenase
MLKKAIVVGASSGIGAQLVLELVNHGYKVVAMARREAHLADLRNQLNTEETRVWSFVHDVTASDSVASAFHAARETLDGVDLLVYAAGVMPSVGETEYDFEVDRQIMNVNLLGAMAWLDVGASHMMTQGTGTLVGIGSVAGDRGRRGNPAYCASKAGLHTYLEALRNRLDQHGVTVLTVKPGPVETPMTADSEKLPMLIPVERAAAEILSAIQRGRREVYVPFQWRPIMAVIRAIPSVLFRRLDI